MLRRRGTFTLVLIGQNTEFFNQAYRVCGNLAPAFWGRQVAQRIPELIESLDFQDHRRQGGTAGLLSVAGLDSAPVGGSHEHRDFSRERCPLPLLCWRPNRFSERTTGLAYGLIATGGRGRYLNGKFQQLGAQCVALCDVYEPNLEVARQKSPDAKRFSITRICSRRRWTRW